MSDVCVKHFPHIQCTKVRVSVGGGGGGGGGLQNVMIVKLNPLLFQRQIALRFFHIVGYLVVWISAFFSFTPTVCNVHGAKGTMF